VNALHGYGRGRVYPSAKYKAWIAEANVAWLQQRHRLSVKSITGRYRLSIYATPPALNRARDAGNLEKAVSDFLQMKSIIANDSLAKSVFTEWADELATTASIIVKLMPYP
jgi:Holliday junction resolvase RusA-like endonuclease